MKIAVVGLGYVGLSNALMLALKHEVVGIDIDQERVDKLNSGVSPILDAEISYFLKNRKLDFSASTNLKSSLHEADYAIIAVPTDYDTRRNNFDTSVVEEVIHLIRDYAPNTYIIVKSTVPIGFIDKMRKVIQSDMVSFSPEFLREGKALYDNLRPSRIIIGDTVIQAQKFAELMSESCLVKDVDILCTGTLEAEAIKLFSNAYLAMRISFFNELDSFAMSNEIDSKQIILGVSGDPRIGHYYNNPSFGYGGYCLPKDTRQLLANYDLVPQKIMRAIVDANATRKKFISNFLIEKNIQMIGVYRLTMKSQSDNFRDSAIIDVILDLQCAGIDIVIYEPTINEPVIFNARVENNLEIFKQISEIVISNRNTDELEDIKDKLFTRDIFGTDL